MEPNSVFATNSNMVMVHKGWKNPISKPTDSSHQSRVAKTMTPPHRRELEKRPKVMVQEFEFVNGTDPFRNRDPDVRRLVRAHVVRDGALKRRAVHKSKNISLSSSVADAAQKEKERENGKELVPRSRLQASLDPNPELSGIIHHVAEMGVAMWPLDYELRFNPISPAGWFDWALGEEVLLNALLYTTQSYRELMGGAMEKRESVRRLGRALELLRGGLSGEEEVKDG
jgi:hypothetical protein